MLQIRIRITNTSRARLVLTGLLLLGALALGLFFFDSTSAVEQTEAAAESMPKRGGRHFYLTSDDYPADEALNACTTGYHMASLWEILDVSNLTYAHDHPDAYTQDDAGFGPPSRWNGWVRTGRNSSGSSIAGSGNCLTWTSTDSSHYGTAIRLAGAWESAPGEIGTWDAGAYQCGLSGPVWCVGDFTRTNLPVILK